MTTDEASEALSEIETTAIVIGTKAEAGAHFMFANWGTQASFEPWRYVIAIKKTARTLENVRREKGFTVNLLNEAGRGLVKEVLSGKADGAGDAARKTGAPKLPDSYAGFECRLVEVRDMGGDHVLVVGDVLDGWKTGEGPALRLDQMQMAYSG